MRFGRLDGYVTMLDGGQRWITVVLDTGVEIETVRDEAVPEAFADHDAAWLADQMVQETLGNELALEGWEVIGEGQTDHEQHRLMDVVAHSPTWIVRKL
jgi:hypothetical protein